MLRGNTCIVESSIGCAPSNAAPSIARKKGRIAPLLYRWDSLLFFYALLDAFDGITGLDVNLDLLSRQSLDLDHHPTPAPIADQAEAVKVCTISRREQAVNLPCDACTPMHSKTFGSFERLLTRPRSDN